MNSKATKIPFYKIVKVSFYMEWKEEPKIGFFIKARAGNYIGFVDTKGKACKKLLSSIKNIEEAVLPEGESIEKLVKAYQAKEKADEDYKSFYRKYIKEKKELDRAINKIKSELKDSKNKG